MVVLDETYSVLKDDGEMNNSFDFNDHEEGVQIIGFVCWSVPGLNGNESCKNFNVSDVKHRCLVTVVLVMYKTSSK